MKSLRTCIVSLLVTVPGTSSTVGIKCGGFAKCATAIRVRLMQRSAIASTGNADVELARTVPWVRRRSNCAKTICFSARYLLDGFDYQVGLEFDFIIREDQELPPIFESFWH